jgi:hypothetical protein
MITSTGTRLVAPYLFVREPFAVTLDEAEVGAGLTLTARFCELRDGSPAAINAALEDTAITASGGEYTFAVAPSALITHLTPLINRTVHLHLFDQAGSFYETYPFRPVDTDPDLLSPPR